MGGLFRTPLAPPEHPQRAAAAVGEGAASQPLENGNPEDDEQELLIPLEDHSVQGEDSPRE